MSEAKSKSQASDRRIDFPVIEGIAAAAARIGAPESLVKQVKRDGSKAFLVGGRVDTGILIPELFARLKKTSELPDGVTTPQDWLATEKARRERIRREVDEKAVLPAEEFWRQAAEAMALTFAELERRDRELPPALAGLSAIEIHKRMAADTEAIRRTLKEKFESIGK